MRDSYHELIAGLASRSLEILDPVERRKFMEARIKAAFDFMRVDILLKPGGPERFSSGSTQMREVLSRTLGILRGINKPFLSEALSREVGVLSVLHAANATYLFPIKRGEASLGVLAIDSQPISILNPQMEQSLLDVCSQVAIVLENSGLLQGKLELEHTLARQAQMVQLGEMAARIAHEIKNPMSAIKTIIQVMQEDASLHPRYTKDLELVNDEVDRLSNNVMQLLAFAKPGPSRDEAVSLRSAAQSALQFLERDIVRDSIVVDNDIPEELPSLSGSISTFREIFLNLILNAIQAGGKGTRLTFQAWQSALEDGSEKFVLLVVEDDGPGIPGEVGSKVFAPFYTTKQRGTGLGLAIVKRDIEHLGGSITLESPARNGHGARFLIHFPYV